jgi:malto-oligosyltrehalose synthase/4-alpha-glucanotransferase
MSNGTAPALSHQQPTFNLSLSSFIPTKMFNPLSTYRIQFHQDFTFAHLDKIVPYLTELGVKTLYASPIFKAVPGSNHGYDNVDPLTVNPEIGTLDELRTLSKKLRDAGISWLQDIVPNHMAFHYDNAWLMDVLEKGPTSLYRNYFDQSLADHTFYKGPIMVPFLGEELNDVIDAGELTVDWHQDRFVFKYTEQIWPLNLDTYEDILFADNAASTENIKELRNQVAGLKETADPTAYSAEMAALKPKLVSLMQSDEFNSQIKSSLQTINQNKDQLKAIAAQQHYRLCSWKETDQQINYRRFFTVNGLICLNIQRLEVFNHVHELVKALLEEGIIHGLRIDHIDGLYDPAQYLQRLRALTGDETYIVVEKILEPGEDLPASWPIQGSTGYDYLALVNNLFTNQKSEETFTRFYQRLTTNNRSVHRQIHDKKALILSEHMNGELDNLTSLFIEFELSSAEGVEVAGKEKLKQAIAQLLIRFPVYRFYGNSFPLNKEESANLAAIFSKIQKANPELLAASRLLEQTLLEHKNDDHSGRALQFYQRCMQFTGPLMAKGVEDTLMYTYNRFIDHNEVGDSPEAFGLSVNEFHALMEKRQQEWPLAINATSTHDTKRGEGVRARLNVLTSIADEWLRTVIQWQSLNQHLKTNNAPDDNDEYFIYQTLVGAYPMPGRDEDDFENRLNEYLEKVLREAKRHSTWSDPNESYEQAVKNFAEGIFDNQAFLDSFRAFHKKVSSLGTIISLTQVTLKMMCPGVPDVYQGCEHWDLSLVDPDNRRPVDYELRQQLLTDAGSTPDLAKLWEDRFGGQVKVWLVKTLLSLRAQYPGVFSKGSYVPLEVKGRHQDNIIAFSRYYRGTWLVTVVPVSSTIVGDTALIEINKIDWEDTKLILPKDVPETCTDLITGRDTKLTREVPLSDIIKDLPIAVLKFQKQYIDRNAGILMHITSLPSNFGIGDFGLQAKKFVDLLHSSGQSYWQILPLNATSATDGYSPYSAYSSQAGNTLLISPEPLANDGLLNIEELKAAHIEESTQVNFEKAAALKNDLLSKAWHNFKKDEQHPLQGQFQRFCDKESVWLDNYALYSALKVNFNNAAWNTWDDQYKFRDKTALNNFAAQNADAIAEIKWQQFIFSRQWLGLKAYCNQLGIQIFGDLPFYISYDSADVWTNSSIFKLDQNLEMISVSGVPPDYFNADGQRWGMPVFNWERLKETNYNWWITRIKKNLEWYDLLRLDHFRAFSAYWDIPGTDDTAVNGTWVTGPGCDLFDALKNEFGVLPFVAEDLGDIDDNVIQLINNFKLPGMKVLQFAFGDDMSQSPYVPHHHTENSFVYTGTHDNNTTLGWFHTDAGKTVVKNLKRYTGIKVNAKNINKVLIKIVLASVGKTAIIPIQDWLDLDEKSRMNTPAGDGENWTWSLTNKLLKTFPLKRAKKLMRLYNRV